MKMRFCGCFFSHLSSFFWLFPHTHTQGGEVRITLLQLQLRPACLPLPLRSTWSMLARSRTSRRPTSLLLRAPQVVRLVRLGLQTLPLLLLPLPQSRRPLGLLALPPPLPLQSLPLRPSLLLLLLPVLILLLPLLMLLLLLHC
jgi:hypothetical protein